MANLKKDLPSGASIDITLGSFQEGHRLLKAVVVEVRKVQLTLPPGTGFNDFLSLELGGEAINVIKDLITGLIISPEVEDALWPLMGRSLYNGQRITKDLFENEKFRPDFLAVTTEVLVFNLKPFFENLASLWKNVQGKITDTQK
jgi:hypothetical protein